MNYEVWLSMLYVRGRWSDNDDEGGWMRNIDQSDATDETIESNLLLRQHKINENISNQLFNTGNVIVCCHVLLGDFREIWDIIDLNLGIIFNESFNVNLE